MNSYTINVADYELKLRCGLSEEELKATATKVDGLIRGICSKSNNVSKTEAAILCALEFCTAYSKYCCANIEDIHVHGITAVDSDAAFRLYAKNGATIRNVSIEGMRANSRMMNLIDCQNGVIDNIKIRDVEVTVSDRFGKSEVDEWQFNFRGNHVFKAHNASRVVLDGLKFFGTLSDTQGEYSVTDCPDLIKRDCNF